VALVQVGLAVGGAHGTVVVVAATGLRGAIAGTRAVTRLQPLIPATDRNNGVNICIMEKFYCDKNGSVLLKQ